MSAEARLCRYITATAYWVAERQQRDADEGTVDAASLAEDVAWLARQVARLAEMLEPLSEAERIEAQGLTPTV